MNQQLNRRLKVVLGYARRTGNKKEALAKAEVVLDEFFERFVKYTFIARVQKQLKNPRDLSEIELEMLRKKTIAPKLDEFRKILEDL